MAAAVLEQITSHALLENASESGPVSHVDAAQLEVDGNQPLEARAVRWQVNACNASCEVSVRGVAKTQTFHSEKRQKTPRIKIVYDFGPVSRSASQE